MDLKQLEAFVAVATLGSFRAAAARLNLSQPAVSSRIAALEAEVGGALFIRSRHPTPLTEKANEILPYAEQILDVAQLITPARGTDLAMSHGTVRLGTNSSLVTAWFPDLVWYLHTRLPSFSIECEIDDSHRLRDMMMHGTLDACLMYAPPEASGIRSIPMETFRNVWAARPGLVPDGRLEADKLADYLIVTFSRHSEVFSRTEAALRRVGRWPSPVVTASSSEMIIRTLERTRSVGTVVEAVARREVELGRLEILDCDVDLPESLVSVCYALSHGSRVGRLVSQLATEWHGARNAGSLDPAGRKPSNKT